MIQVILRITFWSVAYLLIATLPLGIAILGQTPPGRGFLTELGVGLGMVGFAMLAMQFASTSRFQWVAPYFGTDAQIQFHRETGILALAFVLAHPIVLFFAEPRFLHYLNPWENLPRALFLSCATVALLLLVVLPLWRVSLGLNYEWWRVTHGVLAAVVILVGLAHVLQVGHYASAFQKQAGWIVGAGLALGLLVHTRFVKPWRTRSNPWRIVDVRQDCPDVYNLVLEPERHDGIRFRAGQYAWLTVGDSPFTLQQHPFSFVSSDSVNSRLEFGIKVSGDFTATIKTIRPPVRAYIEGPYGRFVLDPAAEGAVFVVGGIGITPALSILRSCGDRNDQRTLLLIYANNGWKDIAYRQVLDDLTQQVSLTIVHVLESPPDDWSGETGLVTGELLARHLVGLHERDMQYFVCGPPPMMDAVEAALVDHGVPLWRLVSERFDLV